MVKEQSFHALTSAAINQIPRTYEEPCINGDTYITASSKLFTALKKSKKIPGPSKPIAVMRRRTESTVHFWLTRLSAKCPAAAKKEK